MSEYGGNRPLRAPVQPDRVRRIERGFAFVPNRFLHGGFFASLSHTERSLYFFLVLAGDRNGVSYYSYDRICTTLEITLDDQERGAIDDAQLAALDEAATGAANVLELLDAVEHERRARARTEQVVQTSADRQGEAEKLYERFLAEFDGQHEYRSQGVERGYRERAKTLLTALRFTAIGKPAPEIGCRSAGSADETVRIPRKDRADLLLGDVVPSLHEVHPTRAGTGDTS